MRTNIIEARFKGGTVTEALPVYQWDYGQILTFPDLSLPANYEVHFARGMRTIATVLGDASGVIERKVYIKPKPEPAMEESETVEN